jgi:hypothetical protein
MAVVCGFVDREPHMLVTFERVHEDLEPDERGPLRLFLYWAWFQGLFELVRVELRSASGDLQPLTGKALGASLPRAVNRHRRSVMAAALADIPRNGGPDEAWLTRRTVALWERPDTGRPRGHTTEDYEGAARVYDDAVEHDRPPVVAVAVWLGGPLPPGARTGLEHPEYEHALRLVREAHRRGLIWADVAMLRADR